MLTTRRSMVFHPLKAATPTRPSPHLSLSIARGFDIAGYCYAASLRSAAFDCIALNILRVHAMRLSPSFCATAKNAG